MPDVLVRLSDVSKVYGSRAGKIKAVDDVSLELIRGETLGLVGESGSGKSTIARLVMGLQPVTTGAILYGGVDIADLRGRELLAHRRRTQMIFQNPQGSLLPHFTALANIVEPMRLHRIGTVASRRARGIELLETVGLGHWMAELYPRQLSGGQQQRVAIARALALEPELLVCDEPTSALDVSIQAQILALLQRLQDELGLTTLFISHHLGVVERLASTIAVMKEGSIVEVSEAAALFDAPQHPYTRQLLAAVLPVRGDVQVLDES